MYNYVTLPPRLNSPISLASEKKSKLSLSHFTLRPAMATEP